MQSLQSCPMLLTVMSVGGVNIDKLIQFSPVTTLLQAMELFVMSLRVRWQRSLAALTPRLTVLA